MMLAIRGGRFDVRIDPFKGIDGMLEAVFSPRSVAVVGASPDERKLGHTVFRNIVENGYTGALYPVHWW
jgi:predicted CoA-binding protein